MPKNGRITEGELQSSLRRAAVEYGWMDHVVWKSMHSPKGWADLALAAAARPWYAYWELKNDTGKASPDQVRWLNWWKTFGDAVLTARHAAEDNHVIVPDIRISVALIRPADIESAYHFLMGNSDISKWPTPWNVQ